MYTKKDLFLAQKTSYTNENYIFDLVLHVSLFYLLYKKFDPP